MKLYYSPGACSQAAHIVLHETGLKHDSEAVDIRAKKTASGGDYLAINPKGAVPALGIGDEILTENGAILQYIGDKAGNETLLPGAGMERYRVIEWLAYLGSDVHKSFGPLFNPASSDDVRQAARDAIGSKLDFIERELDQRDYLVGDTMTVADPYLFAMLGWLAGFDIDLANWPNLLGLRQRIAARDTVAQGAYRPRRVCDRACRGCTVDTPPQRSPSCVDRPSNGARRGRSNLLARRSTGSESRHERRSPVETAPHDARTALSPCTADGSPMGSAH